MLILNLIVVVIFLFFIFIKSSISSTLYILPIFFSIKVVIKDVLFLFICLVWFAIEKKPEAPKLKIENSIRKSKTKFSINKFVLLNFLNNKKKTTTKQQHRKDRYAIFYIYYIIFFCKIMSF